MIQKFPGLSITKMIFQKHIWGEGGDEIMTNLIKSRSIPPMGALRPISDPLPYFAYTSFTGWLHPWLVWDCSSHSRIFHSFENVTIAGEGLQIVTYARQLWPLSSEGSLTCHTYCDTSQPFIVVMSEDPGHSHSQWGCLYLFEPLRRTPKTSATSTPPRR